MRNLIFTVFALTLLCQCKEKLPNTRTQFPEVISPIYYIDTMQIASPIAFRVDSIYYIMSETEIDMLRDKEILDPYKIIRFLTAEDEFFKGIDYIDIYYGKKQPNSFYDLMANGYHDIGNPFVFVEKINEYYVYKFKYEPKTFLLILMAREEYIHGVDDVITAVDYSLDYILAVTPIFHKKDKIKLRNEW